MNSFNSKKKLKFIRDQQDSQVAFKGVQCCGDGRDDCTPLFIRISWQEFSKKVSWAGKNIHKEKRVSSLCVVKPNLCGSTSKGILNQTNYNNDQ